MAVEIDHASKGLLGAFAIFVLGGGFTSLAYGILLLLRHTAVQYNYGLANLFLASIALIIIGVLLIITVILGVYGAWKNVTAARLLTLILAVVLFLVLAITGIWTMYVVQTGRLKSSITSELQEYTIDYKDWKSEWKTKADYLQQQFKCCLVDVTNADIDGIPESCCKLAGCKDSDVDNKSKYFENRCDNLYTDTKGKTVYRLSVVVLAAGAATLLGLILYGILYQRQAHAGYAGVSRG